MDDALSTFSAPPALSPDLGGGEAIPPPPPGVLVVRIPCRGCGGHACGPIQGDGRGQFCAMRRPNEVRVKVSDLDFLSAARALEELEAEHRRDLAANRLRRGRGRR